MLGYLRNRVVAGAIPRHAAYALITSAAILAATPTWATTTTVTLDLSTLPTGAFTSPLTVDGFTLTPLLGIASTPKIVNANGIYALESTSNIGAAGADTYLTMVNGGTFSMVSVEVAALGGDYGTYGIAIAGPNGGIVVGSNYGIPVSSNFTLQDLTGIMGLSDQSSIDLDPVSDNGNNFAISAITVSYTTTDVPEPATIGLFGLGLTGLIAARRRQTSRTS